MSTCVEDATEDLHYRCACVEGATGTPGVNGTGCIVPSMTSSGGLVLFSVSDADDIHFQLGDEVQSVLAFDGRLRGIETGAVIDAFIGAQVASLSTGVTSQLGVASSDVFASFSTTLSTQVTAVLESAASDADAKVNDSVSMAASEASSLAAALASSVQAFAASTLAANSDADRSTARMLDVQTLDSAKSYSDTTKSALIPAIAGMLMWGYFACSTVDTH
jgi:hypothetical protein